MRDIEPFETIFRGADLRGAKVTWDGSLESDISLVKWDEKTEWPEDYDLTDSSKRYPDFWQVVDFNLPDAELDAGISPN